MIGTDTCGLASSPKALISEIWINIREVKNGFIIEGNYPHGTSVAKTKEEVIEIVTAQLK